MHAPFFCIVFIWIDILCENTNFVFFKHSFTKAYPQDHNSKVISQPAHRRARVVLVIIGVFKRYFSVSDATNIAEDVIYVVRAEVVKHHPEKLK